ncbi:hypothetical protein NX80_014215 [Xanthomonas vasicola pv. arecae]|nr:hypothetical protein NX80_014215 [Xanthomonas vasicola pv. arecae]
MQSSIQARWHVVCVGFCMPALLGCTRAAPEQQLRATLEQMHQAIEACEIGTAMAPVAEDFVGENGLDAAGLRRLVQAQMLGNAQIGVTMGPVDVALRGDTATVQFTALFTGGNGRWVPDQAQTYQVTTGWRLQGSDWQLYHAQWAPAGRGKRVDWLKAPVGAVGRMVALVIVVDRDGGFAALVTSPILGANTCWRGRASGRNAQCL